MKTKILKSIYILLILTYIVSLFITRALPEAAEINENLLNEPIQSDTTRQEFNIAYRGKEYNVKPLADYELWGLIVSKNNINAWYNYYHDENSVNLKDICVVWGPNIRNEVYRDKEIKFKSGEWTCYYEWSGKLKKIFFRNKLSNNHLLTSDEHIQNTIRNLNIGDQIYLKGSLVDYAETGSAYYRKTSLSRDDTDKTARGGGSCEIMYVDEMEIYKKNQPFWNFIKKWNLKIIYSLAALQLIFFLFKIRKKSIA